MNRAIILAVLLIPASAWAQWPANWPMGDYSGRTRALCVYSALTERASAADDTGYSFPSAPGMFTQRTRCVQYKTLAKQLIDDGYFVDTTKTNSDGTCSSITTNVDSRLELPMLTWTSACAYASVNTNFHARTPLMNLGSDTNYGWIPFKALLNTMLATGIDHDAPTSVTPSKESRTAMTNEFYMATNSWADLHAAFLAHYADTNNWGPVVSASYRAFGASYYAGTNFGSGPFAIATPEHFASNPFDVENMRGVLSLSSVATSYYSRAEYYVSLDGQNYFGSVKQYTNLWTNAVSQHPVAYRYDSEVATNAATRYSRQLPLFGGEVDMQLSAATPPPMDWSQILCAFRFESVMILHWNVTNGFKYVP